MVGHGTFDLRVGLWWAFRIESAGGLDHGWIGSDRGGCWGLWRDLRWVRLMVGGRVGVDWLGAGVWLGRRRRSGLAGGSPRVVLRPWGVEVGGALC